MTIKTLTAQLKAAGPDDGLGDFMFTGYASVFDNVDSYGDKVLKGAFAETLGEWKASGNNLPVLWGHDMHDPESNIGWVTEAKEDDHGLLITAQLDVDSAKAATVYRLLKGRRVTQMSFAYEVLEGAMVTKSEDEKEQYIYELRKLKLYEVSVVPIGANQETEILVVKANVEGLAASVKAGRALSAKNEDELRKAYESIGRVLEAVSSDDSEKASGTGPSEKASPSPSVVSLAALETLTLDLELTV